MLTDGSVSISNYESTLKRINMLYAESFENLDEKYVCPFSLNIPISTESNTIYDGSLRLDDATDYKFMQIN